MNTLNTHPGRIEYSAAVEEFLYRCSRLGHIFILGAPGHGRRNTAVRVGVGGANDEWTMFSKDAYVMPQWD